MDERDLTFEKSEDYMNGWRDMRIEFANRMRQIVLDVSQAILENPSGLNGSPESQVLVTVSGIYSWIFGSEDLFVKTLQNGRLMSEPEIRYNRLATKDEMHMPFAELEKHWIHQRENDNCNVEDECRNPDDGECPDMEYPDMPESDWPDPSEIDCDEFFSSPEDDMNK